MAQQSPELVVMDDCGGPLKQPSLDLQEKSTPGIPVIRMTDVPQDSEKNVIDTEVVLTKPFSPTQLVAEVRRLVQDP